MTREEQLKALGQRISGTLNKHYQDNNKPLTKENSMTNQEVMKELAKLRAENEALKETQAKKLNLKVSPKGCIQLNGLRRFPVSFYAEEWATIFGMQQTVEEFIKQNKADLDGIKEAKQAAKQAA